MSRLPPTPPPGRALAGRAVALALAVSGVVAGVAAGAGACRPAPAAGTLPRTEFLLGAGDSTYWVRSGPGGAHVRASPMLLARVGGRLYEVYAADDDWSYYDAVFTAQRIYRRDLLTGDSASVWDDPAVVRLARGYAAAHPHEAPLAPDEDAREEPATVATAEVALVDVHGPYLTLEHRRDLDVDGTRHQHSLRRAVVDLRTGRRVSVVELLGDSAARVVVDDARRRFRAAVDSVRALAADADPALATRALRSLPGFRFDPASFGLGDVDGRPAITFVVPGNDAEGRAVTLPLPPVPVPGRVPAWWASDVRPALPTVAADSSEARWRVGDVDVVARYAPEGDAATLLLRPARAGRAAPPRGGWTLARVPAPARQLVRLDGPSLAAEARRALARAFNESTLYGEEATSASHTPAPRGRRAHPLGGARRGTHARVRPRAAH